MGARARNGRQTLSGKVGFSKIRYCPEHNEAVKAVKEFGRKGMKYACSQGCSLHKDSTILKVPEGPSMRR
jgi:hypothetical protein